MRMLIWIFRGLLFLLLLGFAIKNDEAVSLRFFFGSEWSLPLVFILLLFFAVGILMGVTATLMPWLRQRREISRLRRQVRQLEKQQAKAQERQEAVAQPPAVVDGDSPEAY